MKLKNTLLMLGALASMEKYDDIFIDDNGKECYKDKPIIANPKHVKRLRIEIKNSTPKPARKGAFQKKLSKKQRKRLKNK